MLLKCCHFWFHDSNFYRTALKGRFVSANWLLICGLTSVASRRLLQGKSERNRGKRLDKLLAEEIDWSIDTKHEY